MGVTKPQMDPEVVVLPTVFGEVWGTKADKPHLSNKNTRNTFASVKFVVVWPWYPRPPKKHVANKNKSGSLGVMGVTKPYT